MREECDDIRIVVVDDHPWVKRALRQALDLTPRWRVIGEASDGVEALGLIAELEPEVVVMDVRMPVMGGAETTRHILGRWPNIRVLGFGSSGDLSSVATMLEAGACGYVLKGDRPERLVAALQAAVEPAAARSPRADRALRE